MKIQKLVLGVVILMCCQMGFAQNSINYKALIKDDLGNVLVSQTIDVKFTIIADTGSTEVYIETHTGVLTDANGIIVLNLGEGNDTLGDFFDIIWSSDTHSLKTEIDIAQDSTFEFMSTTQFMAVPYALHSETAASATYATTANNVTGLVTLNQGNGTGWRLKGNSLYHANIGSKAVDLSIINNGSGDAEGASGEYSIAMGLAVTASGVKSIAMGVGTTASGEKSTAMGSSTTASGENSTAIGTFTTASGRYSTAMGFGTNAPSYRETAVGSYNTEYIPNETNSWNANDRLFVVGNGTSISNRRDALTILKNGATTVNESTPSSAIHALSGIKTHTGNNDAYGVYGENTVSDYYGYGVYGRGGFIGVRGQVNPTGTQSYYGVRGSVSGGTGTNYGIYGTASNGATNYAVYAEGNLNYTGTLTGPSDRKLKTNINKLNNGMATIMSLQPSTYSFKEGYQKSMHVSNKPQFGFMAQELQAVLPELVSENMHPGENKEDPEISYLGINYIGLIPILTAGIQEQEAHIKTLEDKIEAQKRTLESLIVRIEAIENR